MKQCVNCGFELDDKAQFCMECGTKQPPQQANCVECGAELQPGAKFCPECGAKQVPKKRFCSNCGTELQDGMKFCVECGTPAQEVSTSHSQKQTSEVKQTDKDKKETSQNLKADGNPLEDIIVDINCNYEAVKDDDEDLYGFQDEDGEWVIEPKFEDAEDFKGGFAVVKSDDQYGFIKPDGSYLIQPIFEEAYDFEEGFGIVKIDEQYGYVKPNGTYLVEPKFDDAWDFNEEGIAEVELDGKRGLIKRDGSYLVKPKFKSIGTFKDGKAKINLDGKDGYLNLDGSFFIEPIYDRIHAFSDGIARVILNKKFGFVNSDGKQIIDCKFNYADDFHEGFARVEVDGKYGFITKTGSYLVKPVFVGSNDFENGKAEVKIDDDCKWGTAFLYADGTLKKDGIKIPIPELSIDDSFDEEDTNEEDDNDTEVLRTNQSSTKRKSPGLTPFEDTDGKWGYLNEEGGIALLALYDFAEEFDGDYARVILGGNEMFINKNGKLCHDREGTLYNPDDYESEDDDENDDDMSYSANPAPKKKSLFGKVAKMAMKGIKNSLSDSSSSHSDNKTTVRKVWRCHYIGTINAAPRVLDVPSENSTGRPSGSEFVAALKNMGFDDGLAHSIANGGSNLCWECK